MNQPNYFLPKTTPAEQAQLSQYGRRALEAPSLTNTEKQQFRKYEPTQIEIGKAYEMESLRGEVKNLGVAEKLLQHGNWRHGQAAVVFRQPNGSTTKTLIFDKKIRQKISGGKRRHTRKHKKSNRKTRRRHH